MRNTEEYRRTLTVDGQLSSVRTNFIVYLILHLIFFVVTHPLVGLRRVFCVFSCRAVYLCSR